MENDSSATCLSISNKGAPRSPISSRAEICPAICSFVRGNYEGAWKNAPRDPLSARVTSVCLGSPTEASRVPQIISPGCNNRPRVPLTRLPDLQHLLPFLSLPLFTALRQHTHPQQPDEIFPQSELTYGINAPTRLPIVNTRTHHARCRSYNTPIFLDLKPTAAASFYAIVNGLPPLCGPRPAPTLGSGCSRFSLSGPDVYGGRFEPSTTQVEPFRGL